MSDKIKIGISRCLLGQKVRFDGGHKKFAYATEFLETFFEGPVIDQVRFFHFVQMPSLLG